MGIQPRADARGYYLTALRAYDNRSMIITRTPLRISFLGGGTDYPDFYREHGGAVLAATIDKYCYITVNRVMPFFDHRFRVSYSRTELVENVSDIGHPLVRECFKLLNLDAALEIHHMADLPARTGLGSSSSFTVGLLHALHATQGRMAPKDQLAIEAIEVERDRVGDPVGSQDQVVTARGGLLEVTFNTDETFVAQPLALSRDVIRSFDDHLMLVYEGSNRDDAQVLFEQAAARKDRTAELLALGELVPRGIEALGHADFELFGRLLDEGWRLKRQLGGKVTNDRVDAMYDAAKSAGAWGGKLCGAGGAGFMLFVASPDRQSAIRAALGDAREVSFYLEREGTRLIHFDPPKSDAT